MRIALCDDDRDFLFTLNDMVAEAVRENGLSARTDFFASGEELLAQSPDLYDIIFMDIYLTSEDSGLNGVDTIRSLHLSGKTQVVFTTSSREYAVEAFGLHAAHYLIKPVTQENVSDAVGRCIERLDRGQDKILEVKTRQGLVYVPMEQIIFIEVNNKTCHIYTTKDCIQTYTSLESLSGLLDEQVFMRAQRSFIVNMKFIDAFGPDRIILHDGREIMLSRKTKPMLKEHYQKYLFDLTRRGEL